MFLNILIGLIIIGITVFIQAIGTKFWVKHLVKNYYHLPSISFNNRTVRLLIYTALFLLFLNFLEAIIWGLTYYLHPGITEFESLEKAIYFSLVTFTTLGYGEITISSTNRILAGFEAMNGILLLGWSTAMMFSLLQSIVRKIIKQGNKK